MNDNINSKELLVDYTLRKLGAPVINIEVDEEQINDRVNEALKMYYNFHMDGSERSIVIHKLTAEDIQNQYVVLPSNTISVVETYFSTGLLNGTYNNLSQQMYITDLVRNSFHVGANNYVMAFSYLGTLKNIFNKPIVSRYNVHSKKLKITINWSDVKVDQYIAVDCYSANNDDDEVYNDYWLQMYTAALVKKQWGTNITKHSNIRMVGGEVLNGEQIYNSAQDEIVRLEERLRNEFSYIPMPFMG